MNWRRKMCLAIIFLASLGNLASAENQTRAAAVLFSNFETVFHTAPALMFGPSAGSGASYVWEPFGYLRVGLEALGKQVPAGVLADSEAILVGSKDFLPPNGLGSMRSTRCYVIVLRKERTLDFSRYFKQPPVMSASGTPIWNWSANLGEFGDADLRSSSLYATQIAQSYILVANDLKELERVSRQLTSVTHDTSVLRGIREWNDVRQHEFWGYRKYRHGEAQAIDRLFLGRANQITPEVEAVILYVDLNKQTGVLRLLSSSADDAMVRNINATGRITPLKPVGQHVWETIFPLGEVGPFPESANWVLWLFGWGVLV